MKRKTKEYDVGLVLGRFQPLHNGHVRVIETALKRCRTVLVFVGSSQASGTPENPFDYETRRKFLELVFGSKIIIAPLIDQGLGNVKAWGNFVLAEAKKYVPKVDCFVLGQEAKNETWLDPKLGIDLIEIPRSEVPISATEIRQSILEENNDRWMEFIPKQIQEELKKHLLGKR